MSSYFITGIGGDVAQGIARIIRENFHDATLIGSDVNQNNAGGLFVDVFKLVPPATTGKIYIDTLESIIEEFNIDILIPTSEIEIETLRSISPSRLNSKIITPGGRVIDVCLDKYKTNSFLKSIGLDVPWTINADEQLPHEFPCIFKSRKGSGSKLLSIIKDRTESEYFSKRYKNAIFQELLLPDDSEVTCAVFRTKAGTTSILQLQRKLVGGATSWAKVICEPKIDEVCQIVADELELIGSMNIQLRLTSDGPRIFEINPRFSSTVYMRNLIGFSDVIWSIKDILGVDFTFPKISQGTELVRTFDAKILTKPKLGY